MEKADAPGQQETAQPLSDKDLQAARQVVNILIQAWKNYGLYPEDHVNTKRSLENLAAAFDKYFTDHEELRLNVEKDSLLCGPETIYQVAPETSSEDITTLLYRDGIKWIEFQEGLPLEEIIDFFRVAYKYRLFAEETEGDVVTALTDEELEFIDFKAVDVFWQDQLLIDFSKLPPPAPESDEDTKRERTDQADETAEPETADHIARSIALIGDDQLELSNLDYVTLQQMVQEEENWVITEDLIHALIIILKSQTDPEKFETVLGFLSQEAVELIERDRFDLLLLLLQPLHKLFSGTPQNQRDPRRALVDDFFKDLSRPEVFQLISERLQNLETIAIDRLKAMGQALLYFSPDLIPFLVPVILQSGSTQLQQMISLVIVHLSRRDLRHLEKIVGQHGSELGDKLLTILSRLQGDRVDRLLFKMCTHSSELVRGKAIRELIGRNAAYATKLFPLIDDPSKKIRTTLLTAFSEQRATAPERMLLNYLQEKTIQKKEPDHILACYRALGGCGSDTSIPFLRGILLDRGWNAFFGQGKPVFREGAATALALLNTPKAKDVLRDAAKSRFKVIRNAWAATKGITPSGEKKNG